MICESFPSRSCFDVLKLHVPSVRNTTVTRCISKVNARRVRHSFLEEYEYFESSPRNQIPSYRQGLDSGRTMHDLVSRSRRKERKNKRQKGKKLSLSIILSSSYR
jgi:hypothetical protein